MSHAQQIFMLFFAIIWGTLGNVQPRWKAFHYPLIRYPQPRRRLILSIVIFNFLAGLFFIGGLCALSGERGNMPSHFVSFRESAWPFSRIVLASVLPAFSLFGFYRLWVAVVEFAPTFWYFRKPDEVPNPYKLSEPYIGSPKLELTEASARAARWPNLIFAFVYIVLAIVSPFVLL